MVLTVVADTCSKTVLIKSQTVSSGRIQVSECVTAEFAQNSDCRVHFIVWIANYCKLYNWMAKRCMLVVMWVRVYLHYKCQNALHEREDNNINDVCLLSWILMWSPMCLRNFTYIDGCNLVLWSGKSPGLKSLEKLHYTKLHKSVDIRRMQPEYENPCVQFYTCLQQGNGDSEWIHR